MTKNIKQILFYLAIAALFTPFLINTNTYFPFIITKATVFRVLVELMLGLWVIYQLTSKESRQHLFKNPLILAVLIFSLVIFLSAIFGVNFQWSFFSGNERMEGVFGIWHFVLFFLILATTFGKEDIERILKIQIYVSLLYALVALMAYGGMGRVNSSMTGNRLAGYTGNPSYYAAYALFNAFLALYFYFQQHQGDKKLFNYWLAIFGGESLLMIITGCRGAFLAWLVTLFLIGLIILIKSKDKQLKKIIAGGFLIILIGIAILYSFKNTSFIRENFVLERLTSFSLTDPTTVSRLMSAKTAFNAFLEKPILGWGIENYQAAYIKYFNPLVIKYLPSDFFFDRAHNKPMEVLATTGSLGFVSYLAIFGTSLWIIYKKYRQNPEWLLPGLAIMGAVISYFVQNIFIFDFHESYLMFYLILAFIASLYPLISHPRPASKCGVNSSGDLGDSRFHGNDIKGRGNDKDFSKIMIKYFVIITTGCLVLYSLTFWVIKPYIVSQDIIRVMKLIVQNKGDDAYNLARRILISPTFLKQDTIIGLGKIINSYQQQINKESLQKLVDLLLTNADISLKNNSNYVMLLGKADLEIISSAWNSQGLANAKQNLEQAIGLAPAFPQPRFSYIKLLLIDKNYQEALKQIQEVLTLNDSLPESYYFLSIIYENQGDNNKSLEFLAKSVELGIQINNKDLIQALVNKLVALKRYDLIEKLYLRAVQLDPKDANLYVYLAATYGKLHNKEQAIFYAQKAAELDSKFKQASEEFIKLIEAEQWDKISD